MEEEEVCVNENVEETEEINGHGDIAVKMMKMTEAVAVHRAVVKT